MVGMKAEKTAAQEPMELTEAWTSDSLRRLVDHLGEGDRGASSTPALLAATGAAATGVPTKSTFPAAHHLRSGLLQLLLRGPPAALAAHPSAAPPPRPDPPRPLRRFSTRSPLRRSF
uniref:Uncharacterized protein n=1 Tax=Pristionchus pacificus TaxID=54126 RepID=A0A2A6BLP5_PRIPA|eukprot:PDM66819.1 hypothetical protein PRIPAC_48236 [Pristionchus pacificus]